MSRVPAVLDRVARGVLLGLALYTTAHVLYGVSHHDLYLVGWHRVARYLVAPAVLTIGLLWGAWRAPRLVRGQIAIYGTCLLAMFFVFELLPSIRLQLHAQPSSLDEVRERRARGLDAYPAFAVRGLTGALSIGAGQAPLLSNIPDVETVLCSKDERWIDYRADANGFNNPMPYPTPVELAIVGDSFVQGICLDRAQSLVGRIRAAVPRTVGFGIAGHGPLLELGVLLHYVRPLAPRTVVWVYYEDNDLADLEWEATQPALLALLDAEAYAEQALEARGRQARDFLATHLPAPEPPRIEWRDRLALLHLSQVLGLEYGRAGGPLELLERVLTRARDLTRGWDGRIVLVYCPEYHRYSGLFPHRGAMDVRNRQIERLAERVELPFIDLTRAFDREEHPLDLFDAVDQHLSETGAAVAAESILRGLEELPP